MTCDLPCRTASIRNLFNPTPLAFDSKLGRVATVSFPARPALRPNTLNPCPPCRRGGKSEVSEPEAGSHCIPQQLCGFGRVTHSLCSTFIGEVRVRGGTSSWVLLTLDKLVFPEGPWCLVGIWGGGYKAVLLSAHWYGVVEGVAWGTALGWWIHDKTPLSQPMERTTQE